MLGGCSASTGSADGGTNRRSDWTVNSGRFVPAGVVSFASLSAAEICGLTDEKTVGTVFGFDFDGFEPSFELGERGARCGFDATSDGFQGDRLDVRWFVGPTDAPEENSNGLPPQSQTLVHGIPATVEVNGELVDATLRLNDRVIRVETYTDNEKRRKKIAEHALALLTVLHTRVAALRPRAQPTFAAPVADVFAFSPPQFCSLLRDRTVDALNRSPSNLMAVKPNSFDVTVVRSDFLWCSKGRGKLELQIGAWINRNYPDQAIRGLPSSSSIGLLDGEDQRTEQARLEVAASRRVDGGVEERVITLIAQSTAYNATSREILRREMDHIIGELNKRLPRPLIYKLENSGKQITTRVPLGFGEPG
jgi:hypothetical protein